jgi:hypothetical protein
VEALDYNYEDVDCLTCPACGMSTEDDYDSVYTTSFPPSSEQLDTVAPFCGVHAAEYRNWAVEHLRDITPVDGATGPHQQAVSAQQVYQGLGRRDPERSRG